MKAWIDEGIYFCFYCNILHSCGYNTNRLMSNWVRVEMLVFSQDGPTTCEPLWSKRAFFIMKKIIKIVLHSLCPHLSMWLVTSNSARHWHVDFLLLRSVAHVDPLKWQSALLSHLSPNFFSLTETHDQIHSIYYEYYTVLYL